MCLIAPAWFPSWQPPAAAAVAVTGGPATIAAATTLATAARLDSLRQRLAFTYALRFQTEQPPGIQQATVDCRPAARPLQVQSCGAGLTHCDQSEWTR